MEQGWRKAIALLKQGYKAQEVAHLVGYKYSSVAKYWFFHKLRMKNSSGK